MSSEEETSAAESPNLTAGGGKRKKAAAADDDAGCVECGHDRTSVTNAIVFCDLCGLGYHQGCYGRPLMYAVPQSTWCCSRCWRSSARQAAKRRDAATKGAQAVCPTMSVATRSGIPCGDEGSPWMDPFNEEGPGADYTDWVAARLKEDEHFYVTFHWMTLFGAAVGIEATERSFDALERAFAVPTMDANLVKIHVKLLRCLGRIADETNWHRSLGRFVMADEPEVRAAFKDVIRLSERLLDCKVNKQVSTVEAVAKRIARAASSSVSAATGVVELIDEDAVSSDAEVLSVSDAGGEDEDDEEFFDYFLQPLAVRTLLLRRLCEEVLSCTNKSNRKLMEFLRPEGDAEEEEAGAGGKGKKPKKGASSGTSAHITIDEMRAAQIPAVTRPLYSRFDVIGSPQSRAPFVSNAEIIRRMGGMSLSSSPVTTAAAASDTAGSLSLSADFEGGSSSSSSSLTALPSSSSSSSSSSLSSLLSLSASSTSLSRPTVCIALPREVAEGPPPTQAPRLSSSSSSASVGAAAPSGPKLGEHDDDDDIVVVEDSIAPSSSSYAAAAVARDGAAVSEPVLTIHDDESDAQLEDAAATPPVLDRPPADQRCISYHLFQDPAGQARLVQLTTTLPLDSTPHSTAVRSLIITKAVAAISAREAADELARKRKQQKEEARAARDVVLAAEKKKKLEEAQQQQRAGTSTAAASSSVAAPSSHSSATADKQQAGAASASSATAATAAAAAVPRTEKQPSAAVATDKKSGSSSSSELAKKDKSDGKKQTTLSFGAPKPVLQGSSTTTGTSSAPFLSTIPSIPRKPSAATLPSIPRKTDSAKSLGLGNFNNAPASSVSNGPPAAAAAAASAAPSSNAAAKATGSSSSGSTNCSSSSTNISSSGVRAPDTSTRAAVAPAAVAAAAGGGPREGKASTGDSAGIVYQRIDDTESVQRSSSAPLSSSSSSDVRESETAADGPLRKKQRTEEHATITVVDDEECTIVVESADASPAAGAPTSSNSLATSSFSPTLSTEPTTSSATMSSSGAAAVAAGSSRSKAPTQSVPAPASSSSNGSQSAAALPSDPRALVYVTVPPTPALLSEAASTTTVRTLAVGSEELKYVVAELGYSTDAWTRAVASALHHDVLPEVVEAEKTAARRARNASSRNRVSAMDELLAQGFVDLGTRRSSRSKPVSYNTDSYYDDRGIKSLR